MLVLASASAMRVPVHHRPHACLHASRAPVQLLMQIQPGEPGFKRQRAKAWLLGRKTAVEPAPPPPPLPSPPPPAPATKTSLDESTDVPATAPPRDKTGAAVDTVADEDDLASALLATVVPQFESELGPEERRWLTRETAQVYVERCRGKPQSKLEKMFSAAVSWRIERRELLSSRDSPHVLRGDLQSHDARIFGQDGDGDCVIMNCFALSRDYSPRGVSDHLACLFERAIGEFPKEAQGKGRLRWTWVIDVHGFGLQHTDPRVSLEMVTLLECAYVDRLKRVRARTRPPNARGLCPMLIAPPY